jgi:hypothetical protein
MASRTMVVGACMVLATILSLALYFSSIRDYMHLDTFFSWSADMQPQYYRNFTIGLFPLLASGDHNSSVIEPEIPDTGISTVNASVRHHRDGRS